MLAGVDVQSPDVCGKGDSVVRLSQHVQLQQAVEERDPVVAPHQRCLVQRDVRGLDATELTAASMEIVCLNMQSLNIKE